MTYAMAVKALRGKRGEKIRLTLYRPRDEGDREGGRDLGPGHRLARADQPRRRGRPGDAPSDIFEIELTRELIHVDTVKEAKLLPPEIAGDDKIGYLRLEQFGENSVAEFDRALRLPPEAGGARPWSWTCGTTRAACSTRRVDIAGAFLPPGTMVVSTQGRSADSRRE